MAYLRLEFPNGGHFCLESPDLDAALRDFQDVPDRVVLRFGRPGEPVPGADRVYVFDDAPNLD